MDIEDLLARGEIVLEEALKAAEAESLTLDFKENGSGQDAMFVGGKISRAGRSVLAKAISAFSNSAGGHVVIGVDCRSDKGIDRIRGLVPLNDLNACRSSLHGALGDLVQPKHEGVEVLSVSGRGASDQGYLVISVPRSERRPHMSQVDHHYYKRSGSSSFPMEHYDIEDAFRRQEGPLLTLSSKLSVGTKSGDHVLLRLDLFVRNEGRRSALHAEVGVKRRTGFEAKIPRPLVGGGFVIRQIDGHSSISAPPQLVINPGATVPFHRLEFTLTSVGGSGLLVGQTDWNDAYLEIEYELRAGDAQPAPGTLRIERKDLAPFRHEIPGYRGG